MNRSLRCLALVVFSMPSMAWAQKPGENEGERERPRLRRPEQQRPNLGAPGRPEAQFPGGGPPLLMMTKMLPIMMALDSDGDGALSASEIEHASKALLKLDKDGDGLLSADELRPDPSKMPGLMAGVGQGGGVQGQAPGAMMVKMLEQRDANKDGKLEGDEIPERMRERIGMIDKDGDGAISKSELERAAASFGDRGGPGPRGRNESDGSGVKPKRPGSDN